MRILSQPDIEFARERQRVLRREADKYRMLQQIAKPAPPFITLRRLILIMGNLLIAGGLWLKASTRLEQSCADDFSKTVLQ